jgi:hypothetical protein
VSNGYASVCAADDERAERQTEEKYPQGPHPASAPGDDRFSDVRRWKSAPRKSESTNTTDGSRNISSMLTTEL